MQNYLRKKKPYHKKQTERWIHRT